ncbi:MAG: OB-fold nucleic acid binding domain-containing protein [Candidatus Nanopelagicales bacterium]
MSTTGQRLAGQEGPLARLWHRLTQNQSEVEAAELIAEGEGHAARVARIDRCTPGETVTVRGMVRSMTLRPRSNVPALEIELYDGSGSVTVVWLGRRRIPGIDPGRSMVVTGRLTCNTESPTIFNPRYELKPLKG